MKVRKEEPLGMTMFPETDEERKFLAELAVDGASDGAYTLGSRTWQVVLRPDGAVRIFLNQEEKRDAASG
jgi:hypothetical protein